MQEDAGAGGAVGEGVADQKDVLQPTQLRAGSVVEGTVTAVDNDQALVDVGGKADGILAAQEMVLSEGQAPPDALVPGQRVSVTVIGFDAEAGAPRLSQKRAITETVWRSVQSAHRSGVTLPGLVREVVKGGLVLDLGVRAFLPASQVDRAPVADLSAFVGQTLSVRVIEVDRSKNRVVVSRRVILEEERRRLQGALWNEIEEGQVREATVKALANFGAFIDLGGVDGLLHISAMAWGRIGHPSELLTPGQSIRVKVLKVDRERQKVSLGLKQIAPDPWTHAEERYPVGALVRGHVARLAPFGAFVQLEPGIDGLVHISQLADRHVRDPREVVQEGQDITVKVLRVSPEERRISLSLREAQPAPRVTPDAESAAPRAARPQGEFTVAERLGGLGALLTDREPPEGGA